MLTTGEIATWLGLSFAIAMAGWAASARTTRREAAARRASDLRAFALETELANQRTKTTAPVTTMWERVAVDMKDQRDRAVAMNTGLLDAVTVLRDENAALRQDAGGPR